MKPEQLLREPTVQPTENNIKKALGDANDAYLIFINELKSYNIDLEWRYYTDGKAWLAKGLYKWTGVRGGQKETTVFWLSIWDGFFKVTIYIPEKYRTAVLELPLEDNVKEMIANSKQLGEKLKFFPIIFDLYSDEMFKAVFSLVEYKKSIK